MLITRTSKINTYNKDLTVNIRDILTRINKRYYFDIEIVPCFNVFSKLVHQNNSFNILHPAITSVTRTEMPLQDFLIYYSGIIL